MIPAGTNIAAHLFEVHRNPKIWPRPDVYDPDRFLPERIKDRHPFSYVPFSAGPRNCIGNYNFFSKSAYTRISFFFSSRSKVRAARNESVLRTDPAQFLSGTDDRHFYGSYGSGFGSQIERPALRQIYTDSMIHYLTTVLIRVHTECPRLRRETIKNCIAVNECHLRRL